MRCYGGGGGGDWESVGWEKRAQRGKRRLTNPALVVRSEAAVPVRPWGDCRRQAGKMGLCERERVGALVLDVRPLSFATGRGQGERTGRNTRRGSGWRFEEGRGLTRLPAACPQYVSPVFQTVAEPRLWSARRRISQKQRRRGGSDSRASKYDSVKHSGASRTHVGEWFSGKGGSVGPA